MVNAAFFWPRIAMYLGGRPNLPIIFQSSSRDRQTSCIDLRSILGISPEAVFAVKIMSIVPLSFLNPL